MNNAEDSPIKLLEWENKIKDLEDNFIVARSRYSLKKAKKMEKLKSQRKSN